MGRVPGVANATVAAGHNCWGITWAPATGAAMAELIVDGRSKVLDLRPFRVGRFAAPVPAKKRGRKRDQSEVGEQW